MSIPSNWYEDFFHGVPLDLWRQAIPPEQTKAEADFIVKALQCDHGSHLLDVPCGNGRLALELAKRGYRVTGVDISEEFIDEARSSAIRLGEDQPPATETALRHVSEPRAVATGSNDSAELDDPVATALGSDTDSPSGGSDSVDFVLGDMRRIEGEAIYDGAYCFGNSFGFLEYADMESFLNGMARALKPGARFVIETGMAAESILPKFEAESSHEIGDIFTTIKEQYLAAESCVDSEYIFERDGKVESRKAKHWIYTAGEIRRMLERAGFAVKGIFGSLDRKPYELGSTELFVVADRA